MLTNRYNNAAAISDGSDTVNLPMWTATGRLTDAVYVGGAGVVPAVFEDGTVVNFTAVAGEVLPIAVKRINKTNLGASLMVALYSV